MKREPFLPNSARGASGKKHLGNAAFYLYFLIITVYFLCIASPAQAAKLRSWKFNTQNNKLDFTTEGNVQPKAQLLANPTRLVIDLPKTRLKRPLPPKTYGQGAVRSVRIGHDRGTTRIVVQYAPGYTIDPEQVKFRGATARRWTVQLPTPQAVVTQQSDRAPELPSSQTQPTISAQDSSQDPSQDLSQTPSQDPPQTQIQRGSPTPNALAETVPASSPGIAPPEFSAPTPAAPTPRMTAAAMGLNAPPTAPLLLAQRLAKTQIQSLQPTPDGIFIRTTGEPPEIRTLRSGDRRQLYIDLYGAILSPTLSTRDLMVNRDGASRLQISQFQATPPVVRIQLTLTPDSPIWKANTSRPGEILLLPQGRSVAGDSPTITPTSSPSATDLAQVESVELDEANQQLILRANQAIQYSAGWDRRTGAYRIAIPSAQLDPKVRGPQLTASSPLLQVRLRQEDPRTVAILISPTAGIQLGEVLQPNPQTVSLSLRRSGLPLTQPGGSLGTPDRGTPRRLPPLLPRRPSGLPVLPRIDRSKLVVVIDPGHGGPDPGAIGIGGLQEKELVFDISQRVAAVLEQNGVQSVLTRSGDVDLDLQPRVDLAQRLNAGLFVSIHANSINLSRQDISGLETYYFSSSLLARSIHSSVLQGVNIQNRGVRKARFYVLRKTSMPSVLVEVGFVTGREDAANLSNSNYRQQMAEAIARGVLQYLGRRN